MTTPQLTEPHPAPPEAPPRPQRRRRTIAIVLSCGIVLAAGAAGAWQVFAADSARQAAAAPTTAALSTTPVLLGPLTSERRLPGTLRFDQPRVLSTALAGTITGLPAAGSLVGEGGQLLSVDNRPVALVHGEIPAWREIGPGMTPGPDIAQIEGYLQRIGLFDGDVDELFTERTAAGIRAWQWELGQPRTGTLELGAVVFQPGDVLVSAHSAAVGDAVVAGDAVSTLSAQERVVQLDLRVEDLGLAVLGAAATVTLPNGTEVPGVIGTVGSPAAAGAQKSDAAAAAGDPAAPPTVPVIVHLGDQAAVAALPQSSVTVSLAGPESEAVLSVPVEALVALDDARFAVEVPAKTGAVDRVEVSTGLFAAGRVQVTGEGIAEGTAVVVNTR